MDINIETVGKEQMSAGKAKRTLIHTKKDGKWDTMEFLSVSDAKRYLRSIGVRFKDESAFYSQNFGTIIDGDCLIEIEEAFEGSQGLEVFGREYIPLGQWCRKNGIGYKTGVSLASSGKICTVRIGRKGRVFVREDLVNLPYKDRPISVDGRNFLPLSSWARKNGISYSRAHYLCASGKIKCLELPRDRLKKIYVEEDLTYAEK